MKRKASLPPGSFWVAMPTIRPRFVDPAVIYDELAAAFYDLTFAVAPLVGGTADGVGCDLYRTYSTTALREAIALVPDIGEFYPRGHGATLHTATEPQLKALNALWREAQRAIDAAYQHGLEEGRNLLTQLAKGQITATQLHGTDSP